MCGICGIVQRHEAFTIRPETLQRMNDVIAHRGPDDEGFFAASKVGLAMRRLSIIDLNTGHQPIHNEDESLQIVFNGEIYNYQELRQSLEEAGHQFYTKSDTEAIVHGYEEYGAEVVHHLRGMFAFAIWDHKTDTLFLARDRPGIKPLHYYLDEEKFLFGSEIKAILQCERVPREINMNALDRFLTYEYVSSPETIFQGIYKLPPGHFLLFRHGELRIEQYWDNLPVTPEKHEEAYYAHHLAELLEQSVKIRMISDVPLGALLSGGIDSSTVVGFMAKHSSQPVKTFSIGFEDQTYNELEYARTVSKHFGTKHYEFIIKPDAVDLVEHLVKNLDEPFGDFSIFPTYLVCKMAREHVTVALSGDGGDELFAGYDTYIADRLARTYQKFPAALRHQAITPLIERIPPSPQKKGLVNRTKRFIEGTMLPPELMHTRWMMFLHDQEKQQLYTGDLLEAYKRGNTCQYIQEYFTRSARNGVSPLAQQEYVDIKTYLTDDILVKVDRMSMAPSLEARVPFLDHKVMEFAATIPTHLKLKGFTTKYILKKAAADLLPEKILTRGKEGFSIPIKNWLMNELRPLLLDTLATERIKQRGYFQPDYVQRLVQEHLTGKANHSHRLWALMVFEIWHQMYLE